MNRAVILWALFFLCASFTQAEGAGGGNMQITSPEFKHNEYMPAKYTCEGDDINPPLAITGIPTDTKSLALIMDDPDAAMGVWVHWVVFNIPVTSQIEENSAPGELGMTNSGRAEYHGPCPPSGTHHYFFKIYALDIKLNLGAGASKGQLEKAMQGHMLDKAELIGLYKRKR